MVVSLIWMVGYYKWFRANFYWSLWSAACARDDSFSEKQTTLVPANKVSFSQLTLL
jgi:hypothetical protein